MATTQFSWKAFSNHHFWTKPVAFILVAFVILSIVDVIRWVFFDTSMTELVIEAVFIAILISIGLLKAIYPKFDAIIEKGFSYYFYGLFLYFVLVGPFMFFLLLSQWAVTDASPFVQYLVFIFSAIIWVMLLATITYEPWKQLLFDKLKRLGWLLPLIFLTNFIMISVILFGSVSYLWSCGTEASCTLKGAKPAVVNYDLFLSWFLWHVTDAVPVIKIPKTLHWSEPVTFEDGPTWLGVWMVFFKIAVIVPGVGATTAYWKKRKEDKKQQSVSDSV